MAVKDDPKAKDGAAAADKKGDASAGAASGKDKGKADAAKGGKGGKDVVQEEELSEEDAALKASLEAAVEKVLGDAVGEEADAARAAALQVRRGGVEEGWGGWMGGGGGGRRGEAVGVVCGVGRSCAGLCVVRLCQGG